MSDWRPLPEKRTFFKIEFFFSMRSIRLSKVITSEQLLQIFRMKFACILISLSAQLQVGKWMDYLHLKWQVELTIS